MTNNPSLFALEGDLSDSPKVMIVFFSIIYALMSLERHLCIYMPSCRLISAVMIILYLVINSNFIGALRMVRLYLNSRKVPRIAFTDASVLPDWTTVLLFVSPFKRIYVLSVRL